MVINFLNIKLVLKTYKINWTIVKDWIGYIGIGLIVLSIIIGILYLWIKLNKRILTK